MKSGAHVAKGKKDEDNPETGAELLQSMGAEVVEETATTDVVEGDVLEGQAALNPWTDVEDTFASSELLDITSIEEAEAAFAAKGIGGSEGEEIRTGFEEALDKADLVNKPFLFLTWKFTKAEQVQDGEVVVTNFVYATVMTDDGDKGYVTDGSGYGLYHQLLRISKSRKAKGIEGIHPAQYLKCPKGLSERTNKRGGKPTYSIAHLG